MSAFFLVHVRASQVGPMPVIDRSGGLIELHVTIANVKMFNFCNVLRFHWHNQIKKVSKAAVQSADPKYFSKPRAVTTNIKKSLERKLNAENFLKITGGLTLENVDYVRSIAQGFKDEVINFG